VEIRRVIRTQTAKIDALNDFIDWVSFGGPAVKSGDPVEQERINPTQRAYHEGEVSHIWFCIWWAALAGRWYGRKRPRMAVLRISRLPALR
jgi:hypothetical protein